MNIAYQNTQEYFMNEYNQYLSNRQTDDSIHLDFTADKRYQNMNLQGLSFSSIKFKNIEFVNCSFYSCHFDMITFDSCKFKGNIIFKNCSFRLPDFNACYFVSALFVGCKFTKMFLHDNDFGESLFWQNHFIGINTNIIAPDDKIINSRSFRSAYFAENNFESAQYSILPNYIPGLQSICPNEGTFIGWKKGYIVDENGTTSQVLIKLLIPEDAKRSSANSRKCRCDKAEVLAITSLDGKEEFKTAQSIFTGDDFYEVGETVFADSYDDNRLVECSHGIHFFLTMQEALEY